MSSGHVKILVDKFFDKEINNNEEKILFDELSGNEEVREYFKQLSFLRIHIHNDVEEFPRELEKNIFDFIRKKKSKKIFTGGRILVAASYALSIFLIVISLILFNRINAYKDEVKNAVEAVKVQDQTLQLLINNTLPEAQVDANFGPEIIIKSKKL
jgi:hypothetical protein